MLNLKLPSKVGRYAKPDLEWRVKAGGAEKLWLTVTTAFPENV
jgi:hypothetical protein